MLESAAFMSNESWVAVLSFCHRMRNLVADTILRDHMNHIPKDNRSPEQVLSLFISSAPAKLRKLFDLNPLDISDESRLKVFSVVVVLIRLHRAQFLRMYSLLFQEDFQMHEDNESRIRLLNSVWEELWVYLRKIRNENDKTYEFASVDETNEY
ncbi:hypothetical protein HK100_010820, partial [Physocladia obscura]